ncbi:polymorphic toxin type 43 domain-containing protein [Streptomyces sp. NPDC050421]|uniref:polymorphic toxin type 43 domain-containing protein n=1 Tax=Streptomyces sp. NPDC050421 TaxID=3365613 RepID=UPI0037B6A43A
MTSDLDPLRGQPLKVTDANSRVSSTSYDPLGRVSKAWLPTRPAASYPDSPNYSFGYLIRRDGPAVVTTSTLNHNSVYQTSYQFYDGLLRERQTQAPSPDDSGRLVTGAFYNSLGQEERNSGTYYATGSAEPVLVAGADNAYPSSTETKYDGAGRTVEVIAKRFGDPTKSTTTAYTGDTTTVVPPRGGVATTTVTDARNRTIELKQYTDAAREITQSTTYQYDLHGRLAQVTDPAKAVWKYRYDAAGRQVHAEDPDKGSTDTTFNKADQPTDVKDARGIVLHSDYDDLGRRTAVKQGTATLAAWVYDKATKGLGQLSSTTRYDGSAAYTTEVVNYNAQYQPVTSKVVIPAAEGLLAGTYQWTTVYNPNTGQVMETAQPEAGDLPAEDVINAYTYNSSLPVSVSAGGDTILSSVTYDHYGRPASEEYGEFAQHLWTMREFDEHTGAMTRSYSDREVAPQRIEDASYTYDPAGNVTKIATASGQDAARTTDTQCFVLDALRRISEAWTNTGEQCVTAPSDAAVGGPDAYWTSYTYDAVGNRKTETQHKTGSDPTANTVRTYTEPAAGTHDLPGVTQTGAAPGTETYGYDAAGNTKSRTFKDNAKVTLDQALEWDAEGHLKTVSSGSDETSYLYGTDGQRLIRRDSTGATLYLPGGNELHMDKVGLVTGTRYYGDVAIRAGGKLTFLLGDHHGTGTTQVTADAAQAITRRKSTIFGSPRGAQPADWQGDKGFVGGTKDADTRLTHLGAREYDSVTGRFISVDPVMDLADPQQANGYTYGNNNPISFSDPSGLCPTDLCGYGTPKGDGSGEIIDDGPVDPGNSTSPNCHNGHCDGGQPEADLGRGDGGHEIFPGVTVPDNWRGEEEFVAKFYAKYLEYHSNNMWSVYEDEWLTDRTNTQAAGQLRLWVRNICAGLDTCPGGPGNFSIKATIPGASYSAMIAESFLGGVRGIGSKGARGSKSSKAGSCSQCFLAGTDVEMADGSTRNIEEIKAGDEVLSTNPLTGESEPRKVTALIITDEDKRFNELTIAGKRGPAKLTATYEHPFWSPSEQRWVPAAQLRSGMTLLTDDGTGVSVQGNRAFSQRARTYNLSVEGLHTYYVLAGATPVLVHNSNCLIGGSGPAKGVLEVSDRVKSVGAVKNFSPKGERDFIFDPTTGRFATGADQGVGGHDFLGSAVGADRSTMVGGRLRRGPNGELQTNQWSGHYGMNWNDSARKAFQDFMGQRGITVSHTPSMNW